MYMANSAVCGDLCISFNASSEGCEPLQNISGVKSRENVTKQRGGQRWLKAIRNFPTIQELDESFLEHSKTPSRNCSFLAGNGFLKS